jgi:hypothetical protein
LQRDYSSGSIYDYYTHQTGDEDGATPTTDAKPKPAGSPVTTAGGRVFYGGRGIEPDVKVPALTFTPLRFRIREATFFFVRQLIAGQIKGFENYKIDRQNYKQTVQPSDFQINDKLFEAFRAFTIKDIKDKESGLTAENINSQSDYAKSRLREELATANNSSEAGQQVFIETDPQVLRAIEAIPDAKKLLGSIMANK